MKRIRTPVKGVRCTHAQCFERSAFISWTCRTCPICSRWIASVQELVVDQRFLLSLQIANSSDIDRPIGYIEKSIAITDTMTTESNKEQGGGTCVLNLFEISSSPTYNSNELDSETMGVDQNECKEEPQRCISKCENQVRKRKREDTGDEEESAESPSNSERQRGKMLRVLDSLYAEQRMRISARLMDEVLNEKCAVECRLDVTIGQPNFDGASCLVECTVDLIQVRHDFNRRRENAFRPFSTSKSSVINNLIQ